MKSRIWSTLCSRFSHFVNSHYWKVPRFLFISTYVTLVHQLCQYAFPGRRRGTLSEWVLFAAMITQANEMWEYMTLFVDTAVHFYKKGEPYHATIFETTCIFPIIDPELFRLFMSIVIASLPYLGTYVLARRQQRFRVTWLDIRRRYRNEIGSSRYYLTRPLTPQQEPATKIKPTKCQSESILRPSTKKLPKMPRSA